MSIKTRILKPGETVDGNWVAVIEGWHVSAEDEAHAKRIIDTCKMVHSVGYNDAKAEVRSALGLRPYGTHVKG